MDDVTLARWQRVVDRFGLTKAGAKPWDAKLLESSCHGASHGERLTIAFLLNVWDPSGEWSCGKFDCIDALRTWDDASIEAFRAWVKDPMWP